MGQRAALYCRVSTADQSCARQERDLTAFAARAGDVVTVTRIDRLARSTFDLFAIVKRIVNAQAQFRSLAEP